MKLGRIVLVALVGGAVTAVGATGCSLIVDFDASKIDSGIVTTDATGDDSADTADTTVPDTQTMETGDDAADAADTTVDAAETSEDAADAADTTVDSAETSADAADAADTADGAVDSADTAVADSADTGGDTAVMQTCGNGVQEGTEECDKGTSNGQTACAYGFTSCTVCTTGCKNAAGTTSYCSDGKVDTAHETCDDGNSTSGDGCSSGCATETGYNCTGTTSTCTPICGDSLVKGSEQCDKGAANGVLTCTYGAMSCTVCTATCQNAAGTTSYCGDSKIDATNGETCDDGNATASDGCSATCKVETGFACVSVSLPSTCASTAGDGNILWDQLYFNDGTTDPTTESVPGKSYKFLTPSSGTYSSSTTFDVYMLADVGDLTAPVIRFWDGSAESLYPMTWIDVTTAAFKSASSHKYAIWKGTIPAHATGTYFFRIRAIDGTATAYLKSGIPAASMGCSTAALMQPICDSDSYSSDDWTYVIP